MNYSSIQGKLQPAYYNKYILFLFDEKTESGKKRISQKRIIEVIKEDKVLRDIRKSIQESESDNIELKEREFNLFFKDPITTKNFDEEINKPVFLDNLYERISKAKHRIKTNGDITNDLKVSFINDLHYIINKEGSEQDLSDRYINEFKNSLTSEEIKNEDSFLLSNDPNTLINCEIQTYKYYFKGFVNMNNTQRYKLFIDLLTNDYSISDSNFEVSIGFIPIMKETNSGLTIGVRVLHDKDNSNKPRALVVTPTIELDTLEENIETIPISLNYEKSELSESKKYRLSNYRDIEEFIQEQVLYRSNDISDELNLYYQKTMSDKSREHYNNFVFNKESFATIFSNKDMSINSRKKEKEVTIK